MDKNYVAESKKCFQTAEDFALWGGMELTVEEAELILGYVKGHGYEVRLDDHGELLLVNLKEPANEPEALYDISELIERISQWNYEFLLDDTVTGEQRESVKRDADVIVNILESFGERRGYYIGTPTVEELIAILSKLPQDYRVTCCGGENYLYRFENGKHITIDHECFL